MWAGRTSSNLSVGSRKDTGNVPPKELSISIVPQRELAGLTYRILRMHRNSHCPQGGAAGNPHTPEFAYLLLIVSKHKFKRVLSAECTEWRIAFSEDLGEMVDKFKQLWLNLDKPLSYRMPSIALCIL
jgi:hypothetical protein